MPEDTAEIRSRRNGLAEPSSALGDVLRYGLSMAVVLAFSACAVSWFGRSAPDQETAAEIDAAVMVDLPSAAASSRAASDAPDGPQQVAARASPPEAKPDAVEPPKPNDPPKAVEEPTPPAPEKPVEEPPPMPDPPAVLEHQAVTPPPKPAATSPTQAQDLFAPAGSDTPTKTVSDFGEDARPPPSAHAITLWQKSLMKRLEAAKRRVGREPHAIGTVEVAFEIDAEGGLAFARVAQSSGSATLDRAALLLIRQAAPFPAPPGHAASRDTSFVVPVRFR